MSIKINPALVGQLARAAEGLVVDTAGGSFQNLEPFVARNAVDNVRLGSGRYCHLDFGPRFRRTDWDGDISVRPNACSRMNRRHLVNLITHYTSNISLAGSSSNSLTRTRKLTD